MGCKATVLGVKVSLSIRNISKGMEFKDKEALNIVLVNLVDCVDGSILLYSRETGGKTYKWSGNPKGVSNYRIMKAIEWLWLDGLIVNTITSAYQLFNVDKNMSHVAVTNKFVSLVGGDELVPECHKARLEATAVVVFRDDDKKEIKYKNTEQTKLYENQMRLMNLNNSKFDVRDTSNIPVDTLYSRKFNLSDKYNGRMYSLGVMSIENKKSHGRLRLQSDEEKMCEVDYGALHLNLMADLYGFVLPAGDAYMNMLPEGKKTKENRQVVKGCVMRVINCPTRASAIASFRKVLAEVNGHTIVSPSEVMQYVEISLGSLTDHLYSYKLGLVLCNIESFIMTEVVQAFVALGKVLLPVHDSAVCSECDWELLADTMASAYRNRMNTEKIVQLTLNKLVDGVLTKQDCSR